MSIKQQFLLEHGDQALVTTKDIVAWYRARRGRVDRATVYAGLIWPLRDKGYLIRERPGVWRVHLAGSTALGDSMDEFDKYIEEKLKANTEGAYRPIIKNNEKKDSLKEKDNS